MPHHSKTTHGPTHMPHHLKMSTKTRYGTKCERRMRSGQQPTYHTPTPLEYSEYDAMELEREDVIEQPSRELFVSGNISGDWAEEVEQEIVFALEGEYTPAICESTPAPPPTPLHQPPPPITIYVPP